MTYSNILVERDDGVGRIVLNRPEILNPLCTETFAQYREALQAFRESGDVRVVVLTGAGRAFCAGADMKWLDGALHRDTLDRDARRRDMDDVLIEGHALIRELRAFPGPVVSVVNGPAVGGGVGLALAADMVLAAKSAYFSLPFVPNLGLVPDLGGFAFMQKRIGSARAMGCALLGDRLDAETAANWGLIWQCVADHRLADVATTLVKRLTLLPVSAVAALKQMSAHAQEETLPAFLDHERALQAHLFSGDHAFEKISAVIEKLRPAPRRPE